METKVLSIDRLNMLVSELFFNKQSIVTKISDNSVINAHFYGVSKVGQKALVEIANVEGMLFPEYATGNLLDSIATRLGVPPRFGASGSSTLVRLVGAVGTRYSAMTQTFTNINGVSFDLAVNVIIPASGYIFANVRSRDVGAKTNVSPNSITNVTPAPAGHKYVINEFRAVGGSDGEDDASFRQRIINYPNLISESTLEKFNQIFIKINGNVLRTIYLGLDITGKNQLGIISQNGAQFTTSEFANLLTGVNPYISISDLRKFGNNITGITLLNVTSYPIDIDCRINILQNYDPDLVRIDIQTKLAREVDYRFWNDGTVIQWTTLLNIVKATNGVQSCPDKRFLPQNDIEVPVGQLPRFRSFILRDLNGNILIDNQGNLNPIYYSNTINEINKIL
jgi:hypothetical protein